MLFFFGLIMSCNKTRDTKEFPKATRTAEKKITPKGTEESRRKTTQSQTSRTTARGSAKEMAAENARTLHQQEMIKSAEKWLASFIQDNKISTHTRELYAARNHPSIQYGMYYLYEDNYEKAIEEFENAAMDEKNRLSVRFIAVRQRFFIAQTTKHHEDYFKWGKMLGEMLRDNDLSFFSQPRNSEFLEQIKHQEIYFKARNNVTVQDAIIEFLLQSGKGYTKTLAKEEVARRIKQVEEDLQL